MPGKTVAEVKAGWDESGTGPAAQPVEAVYDGNTVAKLTIRCKDGNWNPPKGPALTGVPPIKHSPDGDRRRP